MFRGEVRTGAAAKQRPFDREGTALEHVNAVVIGAGGGIAAGK